MTISPKNSFFIVYGLGNPGDQYIDTRHNIGYKFIDELYFLATKANFDEKAINQSKVSSLIAEIIYQGTKLYLAKSATFMNDSGKAVKKMLNYLKILPDKLIVIHDDVDLKFGVIRKSFDSRSAGHRGVESIIQNLKSQKFYRIRIGIWNLPAKKTKDITQRYVMEPFTKQEKIIIKTTIFPLFLKTLDNLVIKNSPLIRA